MIAANYRKHPEALALQLPLPFGWILKWATAKPTTKALRAIRTARGKTFAAMGRIARPAKPTTPQWAKDAARRARQLAAAVKAACLDLAGLSDQAAPIRVGDLVAPLGMIERYGSGACRFIVLEVMNCMHYATGEEEGPFLKMCRSDAKRHTMIGLASNYRHA